MKILVTDFDKTFFTDEYEKNIRLVNEFVKKGNIFIIATGRPIYLLKSDMEKYEIAYKYLICNDGAVIFDNSENKIFEDSMNKEIAKHIFMDLKKDNNLKQVYIDTTTNFSTNIEDNFNGIVALPIDREKAQETIDYICSKYENVQGYLSHRWINIFTKSASKGTAIKFLADINNWNINEIITVGDNMNDISMSKDFDSYAIEGNQELMINSKHIVKNFYEVLEGII